MQDNPHEAALMRMHRRNVIRRFCLFAVCLVIAASISLAYTYSQPAVYRSSATLLITSRSTQTSSEQPPDEGGKDVGTVAMQRHVVSHPSIISQVWQRYAEAQQDDAESALQSGDLYDMLEAVAVPETNILELRAEGPRPDELPVLVSAWIDVYLAEHAASEKTSTETSTNAVQEQLVELEGRLKAKRAELAAFRDEHNIASMQREENRVLARLKGLTESLNDAEAEEVAAQSRVDALKVALERGQDVALEEDRERLALMEQRIIELRGVLRELESLFSPEHLKADEDVTALKRQIQLLQVDTEAERAKLGQRALVQAEIELATAKNAAESIRAQLAEHERMAAEFTTQFAQHEALVEDLARLEELHRDLQERAIQVEVIREALPPEVTVAQPASTPDHPVRPDYVHDASVGLAGSLLLALAAVVVDWLATRPLRSSTVGESRTVFYPWPQVQELAQGSGPQIVAPPSAQVLEHRRPRELTSTELTELLRVDGAVSRSLIVALLGGLTAEEACALRWSDVDLAQPAIDVPGDKSRRIELPASAAASFEALKREPADLHAPLWPNARGGPLNPEAVNALVLSAAQVACLEKAAEVDAAALQHTRAALLARQEVDGDQLPAIVDRALRADG